MNIQNHIFDVVVVGAGPAGLNAALHVLRSPQKPSVLLVDKKSPWEHPIACAEAVGKLGLHEALGEVPASWVRYTISKAAFHAPDGTTLIYTDSNKGYVIDRVAFQQGLAQQCAELGAQCGFSACVRDVSMPSEGRRIVTFASGKTVSARVVIDASGPVSFIGKKEQIACKPYDLEPAFFAKVSGVLFDTDTVHIYVGQQLAPGGYAWLFPGDKGTANIGIVIGQDARGKVNIKTLLMKFLKENFSAGKIEHLFAGGIPCGYQRKPIAVSGLIKAGDTASTVNPISRAGIVEALLSGGFAGDCAVKMLGVHTDREMKRLCSDYEKEWYEKRGKRHAKLSKVKKFLARVPDKDYNRGAGALAKIDPAKLTMKKIFGVTLSRSPQLILALRYLL